jgi:hypothetical protein
VEHVIFLMQNFQWPGFFCLMRSCLN